MFRKMLYVPDASETEREITHVSSSSQYIYRFIFYSITM
jgi:hypothetical protein